MLAFFLWHSNEAHIHVVVNPSCNILYFQLNCVQNVSCFLLLVKSRFGLGYKKKRGKKSFFFPHLREVNFIVFHSEIFFPSPLCYRVYTHCQESQKLSVYIIVWREFAFFILFKVLQSIKSRMFLCLFFIFFYLSAIIFELCAIFEIRYFFCFKNIIAVKGREKDFFENYIYFFL